MSTILILVWMFMPLLAWAGNALFGRSCHGCLLFCLACLVGYGSMQAAVWAAEVELTADLGRYDRNGDGSFSRDEMTPDAQRAMDALSRDTGRRLAPITGLPLTLVWYGFWFPVLIGTEKLVRRSFAR